MDKREEFLKAVEAERNGEISRDELLSVVKNILMKCDPKLAEYEADQLAKLAIDPSNHKILIGSEDDMYPPDGGRTLTGGERVQTEQLKEDKMDISSEIQAKLDKLLARVDELIPPVETVRLEPTRRTTTVFDSKLGGVPYLPKSMEYPTVREGELAGRPLFLLAQLNFEKLPQIPGFPTEGILQFFAGCVDDDVYGMDFDDGFNQNGFRVIFHEKIITDESALYSKEDMPDFSGGDDYFPFKGEFLLTAERVEPMGITVGDFRCDKVVAAAYNELFGGDVDGMWGRGKGIYDVDRELLDAVCEARDSAKTRMGGFPFFTQEDPRGYNDEYGKCTVMLFQSDSENGGEKGNWDDEICWGDAGVANFFISPEDLAKRDFSHVLYNWDCS